MNPRLVVVLPGGEYGPKGPTLRFPVLALEQLGEIETIAVIYPNIPTGAADASTAFTRAVADQVLPAIANRPEAEVVFVAKSLGTRALSEICERLPSGRSMSALWLTPLFGIPAVRGKAAASGLRSLIVAGAADPYHDQAGFETVAAALDAQTLLLPDADHGLEIPRDVHGTLRAMGSLVQAVLDFMA